MWNRIFHLVVAGTLVVAFDLAIGATTQPATTRSIQANMVRPLGVDQTLPPLQIHVISKQGGAQYRISTESKWQFVTDGDIYNEGVEIRTGPHGSVEFTAGPGRTYHIERLTVVRISRDDLQSDGSVKTDNVGLSGRPGRLSLGNGRVNLDEFPPGGPQTLPTAQFTAPAQSSHTPPDSSPTREP